MPDNSPPKQSTSQLISSYRTPLIIGAVVFGGMTFLGFAILVWLFVGGSAPQLADTEGTAPPHDSRAANAVESRDRSGDGEREKPPGSMRSMGAGMPGTSVAEGDEASSIELRLVPESPLQGEDLQVWLTANVPEDGKLVYRTGTESAWKTVSLPESSPPSSLYDESQSYGGYAGYGGAGAEFGRKGKEPTFTLASLAPGMLQLEVQVLGLEGNTLESRTTSVTVGENVWLSWRQTDVIQHSQAVVDVKFSPNGNVLAAICRQGAPPPPSDTAAVSSTDQVTVWSVVDDLSLQHELSTVDLLDAAVRDDGSLVQLNQSVETKAPHGTLPALDAVSPGYGSMMSMEEMAGTAGSEVERVNTTLVDGAERVSLRPTAEAATGVAFDLANNFFVVARRTTASTWRFSQKESGTAEAKAIQTFQLNGQTDLPAGMGRVLNDSNRPNPTRALVLSSSSRFLGWCAGSVRVWDISAHRRLPLEAGEAQCIAFSPNEELLAIALKDALQIHRVSDGELVRTIQPGTSETPSNSEFQAGGLSAYGGMMGMAAPPIDVADLAFSSSGDVLAVATADKVNLLRVSDGRLLGSLVGHDGRVTAVAISPSGKLLASSGSDKTVRLWRESKPDTHTRVVRAPRHKPAHLLRIDELLAGREYGAALDAMGLKTYLPEPERKVRPALGGYGDLDLYEGNGVLELMMEQEFDEGFAGESVAQPAVRDGLFQSLIEEKDFARLHAALSSVDESKLDADVLRRFGEVRDVLQQAIQVRAQAALTKAVALSGREQAEASFMVYRDYPADLLPTEFVEEQRQLQEARQTRAQALLKQGLEKLRIQRAQSTMAAIGYFREVASMKVFVPDEAAEAEGHLNRLEPRGARSPYDLP